MSSTETLKGGNPKYLFNNQDVMKILQIKKERKKEKTISERIMDAIKTFRKSLTLSVKVRDNVPSED